VLQAPPSPDVVRRMFDACAAKFDHYAFVHDEVRGRLLDRLVGVSAAPLSILDLGCGTGRATEALTKRYPDAELLLLDNSWGMVRQAHQVAPGQVLQASLPQLPLREASVDLVFANLCLPYSDDLNAALLAISRVLRPGGLFAFATLGPDSFHELQTARLALGDKVWPPFADMHLIGDGLVAAGLGEPVLDVDYLQVTYREWQTLWRELAGGGAAPGHTADGGILGGGGRSQQLHRTYPRSAGESPFEVTLELVFGHAWRRATTPQRGAATEFAVPVSEIKRR
jgi:malonyl-CoA O-methyltransferase